MKGSNCKRKSILIEFLAGKKKKTHASVWLLVKERLHRAQIRNHTSCPPNHFPCWSQEACTAQETSSYPSDPHEYTRTIRLKSHQPSGSCWDTQSLLHRTSQVSCSQDLYRRSWDLPTVSKAGGWAASWLVLTLLVWCEKARKPQSEEIAKTCTRTRPLLFRLCYWDVSRSSWTHGGESFSIAGLRESISH